VKRFLTTKSTKVSAIYKFETNFVVLWVARSLRKFCRAKTPDSAPLHPGYEPVRGAQPTKPLLSCVILRGVATKNLLLTFPPWS
jgi:hypothetical protein